MGGDDQQRDEHHRGEEPVEHEGDERQPEHVEADVVMELCVGDPEALRVAEHQPVLPVTDGRRSEQQAGDGGDGDAEGAQPVTEELVEPLDHRVGVGGERRRRETVGDDQVQYRQCDERAAEQDEHQQLGTQHRREHTGPADGIEPQVVGVEAGEEATEQQDADDDDRNSDESDAALVGESTGPHRWRTTSRW